MAYGDIGIFLPAESNYLRPGTFEEALKAEAIRVANYLSSMDQFYANLEEAKREFNETLAYKEKALSQQKELTEKGYDLREQELGAQRQYNTAMLNLRQKELDLLEDKQAYEHDLENKKLALLQKQVEWEMSGPSPQDRWKKYEETQERVEEFNKQYLERVTELLAGGQLGSTGTSLPSYSPQLSAPSESKVNITPSTGYEGSSYDFGDVNDYSWEDYGSDWYDFY